MILFFNTDTSTQGMGGLVCYSPSCSCAMALNIPVPLCIGSHAQVNHQTRHWHVEVKPDPGNDSMKHVSIIHLDTLNAFDTFYVNKYIDHHTFEIAF